MDFDTIADQYEEFQALVQEGPPPYDQLAAQGRQLVDLEILAGDPDGQYTPYGILAPTYKGQHRKNWCLHIYYINHKTKGVRAFSWGLGKEIKA